MLQQLAAGSSDLLTKRSNTSRAYGSVKLAASMAMTASKSRDSMPRTLQAQRLARCDAAVVGETSNGTTEDAQSGGRRGQFAIGERVHISACEGEWRGLQVWLQARRPDAAEAAAAAIGCSARPWRTSAPSPLVNADKQECLLEESSIDAPPVAFRPAAVECRVTRAKFGAVRPRHHCLRCGATVCLAAIAGKVWDNQEAKAKVVCKPCLKALRKPGSAEDPLGSPAEAAAPAQGRQPRSRALDEPPRPARRREPPRPASRIRP
jgi:hypothetical protein